jgi:thioredoxin 1
MKQLLTLIAAVLLLTAVACGNKTAENQSETNVEEAGAMMSAPEAPAEGAAMMMANTEPAGAMMMSSGGKADFTNLDDAQAIAAVGPAVIFFHADWCPTCKVAMKQIDSRLSELGNITVIVVDYDESPDLKKKYGITYQHTYVQIDKEGKKVALWNGGGVDGILNNVVLGKV